MKKISFSFLVVVLLFSCKKHSDAPAPSLTSLSVDSGSYGADIIIRGQSFTASTTVTFNGVAHLPAGNRIRKITIQ